MDKKSFHLLTLLYIMALFPQANNAQTHQPLTGIEKKQALKLEQAAVNQHTDDFLKNPAIRSAMNTTTTGPEYITGIGAMPPAKGPSPHRIAKITRYQYAGGITIHTYVDLDTNKVLSVNPYTNYPTPLSDEETSRAKQLAIQQVPELARAVFEQRGADLEVRILTMIIAKPEHPDYGHRIAKLSYQSKSGKPVKVPSVHVDLTEGKAWALR